MNANHLNGDPAYYLDIASLPRDADDEPICPATLVGRQWLGIRFDCCGAYARIYRNAAGTAYQGRCPHCLRQFTIRVGRGGTNARFFSAE